MLPFLSTSTKFIKIIKLQIRTLNKILLEIFLADNLVFYVPKCFRIFPDI